MKIRFSSNSFFLAASLAAFFAGVFGASNAQALTSGTLSTNPRYAAIVRIQTIFANQNAETCTGTFISSRHILTAAHCVLKKGFSPTYFRYTNFPEETFSNSTASFVHKFDVRYHAHPDYAANPKAGSLADVAVVELKIPVGVKPMMLASARPTKGTEVLLTGYGCDKQRKLKSTRFQFGSAILDSNEGLLKTKPSDVSFCRGDSGGPVLVETTKGLQVAGVNSYFNMVSGILGGSRERIVAVDPKAIRVRSWLEKVIRGSFYGPSVDLSVESFRGVSP